MGTYLNLEMIPFKTQTTEYKVSVECDKTVAGLSILNQSDWKLIDHQFNSFKTY